MRLDIHLPSHWLAENMGAILTLSTPLLERYIPSIGNSRHLHIVGIFWSLKGACS
jgi:hypothetical protein